MKEGSKEKKDDSMNLEYIPVGKDVNVIKEFLKVIPKQFKPTDKLGYIFVAIFVIVIGVGVINAILPALDFSFDLTGEEVKTFELNIDVGLPFKFFGTDEFGRIEIKPGGFLLDFLIWIVLSYIIDVVLNFILSIKLKPSAEELKRKPKEVNIQKRTLSDKAAEKIIGSMMPKEQKG